VLSLSLTVVWLVVKRFIADPVNSVINRLTHVTPLIDTAASFISTASLSLAERSTEQAASIEEISASLEEMSSMTRKNADNAPAADRLMKEAGAAPRLASPSPARIPYPISIIRTVGRHHTKITG